MANVGIDTHNVISSTTAAEIIKTTVKAVLANPEISSALPPIILRGAPGVGKSSIVKSVAKELGIGFIDIRLAQLERVDVAGLPSVENGVTMWNVPDFWPRDPNSEGILFFDEITSAPPDVQTACYSIILDRVIPNSNYRIPDKWVIVAAGNRDIDKAVAKPMSSALANRFSHYELEANSEDWSNWAVANELHPSVTGFINYRPNLLFTMKNQDLQQGWPSPRSWERVSNVIPLFGNNIDVLQKVVYGLIGQATGIEFMTFHKLNAKFDNVLEMLTNPKAKIVIPNRSDEKYALASAISYLVFNGKTETEHKCRIDGMFRIILEMTPDFATMIVKNVTQGTKSITRLNAIKMLMSSSRYKEFADKFGKYAEKTYSLKIPTA